MRIQVENISNAHGFVNNRHFNKNEKFAIISITESNVFFDDVDNIVEKIHLRVSDIDDTMPQHVIDEHNLHMFTDEDAAKIREFVERNKDKVDFFLVHCDAGVSRSRAVAAAMAWVFNGDDKEHFKKGVPNPTIYKLMLKQWGFSNDYEDHVEHEDKPCFICGRTWALESGLWCSQLGTGRTWHVECDQEMQEYMKEEDFHGHN